MRHHHYFLLAAVTLGTGLGVAFGYADHISTADGLYFAVTTGTTVGYGDITPHGWAAHMLAVVMMFAIIPCLGAAFASLTAMHLHRHVRDHIDRALAAQAPEHDEGKADS